MTARIGTGHNSVFKRVLVVVVHSQPLERNGKKVKMILRSKEEIDQMFFHFSAFINCSLMHSSSSEELMAALVERKTDHPKPTLSRRLC